MLAQISEFNDLVASTNLQFKDLLATQIGTQKTAETYVLEVKESTRVILHQKQSLIGLASRSKLLELIRTDQMLVPDIGELHDTEMILRENQEISDKIEMIIPGICAANSYLAEACAQLEYTSSNVQTLQLTLEQNTLEQREESEGFARTAATLEAEDVELGKQNARLVSEIEAKKLRISQLAEDRNKHLLELQGLSDEYDEAESNAISATKLAESQDPKVDALGKWFGTSKRLLQKISGVQNVMMKTDTCFEITYNFGGISEKVIFKLNIHKNINSNTDAGSLKSMVEFQCDSEVDFKDIRVSSKQFTNLDTLLSFLITSINSRLRNHHAILEILGKLNVDSVEANYDSENREMLVHSTSSGRSYLISVDGAYPLCGSSGLVVVGVEPNDFNGHLERCREVCFAYDGDIEGLVFALDSA